MPLFFVYPDNEVKQPFNPRNAVPYHAQKAVQNWHRHFENSLYLTFLIQNEPDRNARAQAQKELNLCDQKMAHWKRHPNWDSGEAGALAESSRKQWQGKRYKPDGSKVGTASNK